MIQKVFLMAGLTLMSASQLPAVLSVTGSGTYNYTQNFDTLAQSSSGNAWANDSTLNGWFLYQKSGSGSVAVTSYGASAGPSVGGFYSLGTDSSSERALGAVGSSAFEGWIAVAFANNSGSTVNSFTVGFDGEQWRNSKAGPQTMVLQYGLGSTFETVSSWISPGGTFDWTSPVTGGTSSVSGIGNTSGLVAGVGGTINSLAWNNGSTLWIRWIEADDSGSDHAMAIDNFSFTTIVPVPEPATSALWVGVGLGGFAMWRLGAGWLRRQHEAKG